MHGRPRVKGPPDPERVKAAAQKAALLGQLNDVVLGARQADGKGKAALQASSKLLELNPEVYTAWNHRRELLGPTLHAGGEAAVSAAEGELALTQKALMRNPKSYAAWHHRCWVVKRRLTSLEAELKLVEALLDADERNFHGWLYRMFLAELMGMPAERELEYATLKIRRNLSNYSAWHFRSKMLALLHGEPGTGATELGGDAAAGAIPGSNTTVLLLPAPVLEREFELVSQAFFTEPEDQSGWIYHRWLLDCCMARWRATEGTAGEIPVRAQLGKALEGQLVMVQELLDMEPDAVWPRKQRAHMLHLQARTGMFGDAADEAKAAWRELATLDPARAGYYRYMLSTA